MAVYYNDEGELKLLAGSTNYQFCPIGSILPFGGTTAPNGFFLCQGQALSRTEYKELFSVIGTSFGSGNGSTTFNLPDLRGEFLRGAGTNSHSGEGNGGTVGTHQGATKVPSIITRQNNIATANYNDPTANNAVENPDYGTILPTSNGVGIDYNLQGTVYSTTLNSIKYTTRPTNTSVNYIIKAKIVGGESDSEAIIGQRINSTVVSNINIATGGATGNVMQITLPPGKWLVFSDGWIPPMCYLITSNGVPLSEGTLVNQSQLGNASAYYQNSTSTTFYLQLVNWSENAITTFTGHNFYAIRIAL